MSAAALVILNFHGLGEPPRPLDDGEASVWLTRESFEAALDVVAGRPDVRITFDDGNASDLTIGVPALRARGLEASFFLAAGLLGTPGFLDAAQVRELVAAGMHVGSHGMLHRPWPGLGEDALLEEIDTARRRIEEIVGRPVVEAACPFGAYDRRSLRRLRQSGYRRVYTSDRGPADPDAWLQPRNTLHRGDTRADVERIVDARPGALARAARAARLAVKRLR